MSDATPPVKAFGPLDLRHLFAMRTRITGVPVSLSITETTAHIIDGDAKRALSPFTFVDKGGVWLDGGIYGTATQRSVDLVGSVAVATFPIAVERVREAQREIEALERNLRAARERLAAAEADRDTLVATVRASIARSE